MNLDSLSLALSQISYSVANLTKKNFKSCVAEISHLINQHGAEADRHLFRCLFSHVDFSGDGKSSGKDFHQTQYLIQECNSLITKPNFVSILCYAIDAPLHHQKSLKPSQYLLVQLSRILRLTKVQEVVFALALLNSSVPETRQCAAHFVKQKFPQLLTACIDTDSGASQESVLQDTGVEVLHQLLTALVTPTGAPLGKDNKLGVTQEQTTLFLNILRKDFPRERVPVVLAPILYADPEDLPKDKQQPGAVSMPSSMMENSLAEMVSEVGYGCTASLEECRNTLLSFGVRELTAPAVARVLGMISRTPSGLPDHMPVQSLNAGGSGGWNDAKDKPDTGGPSTWNVDVLVQVIKDLAPHLQWREVVKEMDHPSMVILSKAGLRLLVQALLRAAGHVPY